MKQASLFLVLIIVCACATHGAAAPSAQAELLKNWALSRCLAKAAGSDTERADAEKSAAAYLESSGAAIETYERLDGLVTQYLSRRYSGSVQSEYNTMKCIDLFRSRDVELIADTAANPGESAER